MNKIRIYTTTFVLGVIFIAGLMMVSAAGFEAPLDQGIMTDAPGCYGGFIGPDDSCICHPNDDFIPGYGCSLCIDRGGPAYAHCEPIFVPPSPTPEFPVPPPPPGGFGGFLQPITGNTFYTSLEYQITKGYNVLEIRLPNGEKTGIPDFMIQNPAVSAESLKKNLQIHSTEDGMVELYLLTTGEFQINIGPDVNGDVRVIIFDGLDAQYVYGYTFNVYDILNP